MELKSIGTRRLLYAMAVEAEYGPHLQGRFSPLITGVGPVEAAIAVSSTLVSLAASGDLPDLVVSLGSAGSATLHQTDVYQAISVGYRDMDASPIGFEKGTTPFVDLPAQVPMPVRIPGIATARLSTGANIVSGKAYESVDADMVDMETFAVLRACMSHSVPLVALRGISDGRDELNHIDDWTQYLHVIDEKLAAAVDRLESALIAGDIL